MTEIEAKLLVGLDQLERGESAEMTEEDWAEILAEVESRFRTEDPITSQPDTSNA